MRRFRLAVVAALSAALMMGGTSCSSGDASRVERAQSLVDDPSRFTTAIDAAETLGEASSLLLDDGRSCEGDRDAQAAATCDTILAAAAYTQVLAATVLRCRLPDIDAARRDLADFLDTLDAGRLTVRPPVPAC